MTAANPQVHNLLVQASRCLAENQTAKAKKLCEEAVRVAPSSADAHMVLADVLAARSETGPARRHYEKATKCEQNHFGAWLNYGVFLKEIEEPRNAVLAFKNAVALDPKSSMARYNLARALLEVGEFGEAVEAFRVFVKMEPRFADGHNSLSAAQKLAGDYEDAIETAEQALRIDPKHGGAYLQLGALYQILGKFEESQENLRKAAECEPTASDNYDAMVAVNSIAVVSDEDEALSQIRAELERDALAPIMRAHFLFAGARILDRQGRYDEAFAYLSEGNALRHDGLPERSAAQPARWQEALDYFSERDLDNWPFRGDPTEQPVFIVGMPRTGTSLVEQILASHPRVYGADELLNMRNAVNETARVLGKPYPQFLTDITESQLKAFARAYIARYPEGARDFDRVTDKYPLNLVHLGAMRLMFPNARIIYCARNPLDTCLSCYTQNFTNSVWFAFDLQDLASQYRMHVEMMDLWRRWLPGEILELRYEELTADPEPHIRSLLEFCGLEWNDACLEFHKTDRGVRTASAWQVRQPMYKSSVAKWKHYEKHLGPLIEGLGDLADL